MTQTPAKRRQARRKRAPAAAGQKAVRKEKAASANAPPEGNNPSGPNGPEDQSENSREKLLDSANDASGSARNAWIAFLLLITYLLVTLAGVTHEDLLLNSPVTLPVVDTQVPLFSFFIIAPFFFVLVHLGLLVQHAMLAHKYEAFIATLAGQDGEITVDHPDRRQVHSYVFSQLIAGQRAPWPLAVLMRGMVFITLILLPILVLLYFQIQFLPYHSVGVTHAHRLAILLDLLLLFTIWPYIARPSLRPDASKLEFGNANWNWSMSYASLGVAGLFSIVVFLFSLVVVTVPHGCVWPSSNQEDDCASIDRLMATAWPENVGGGARKRNVFALTNWVFDGRWFWRNLQLAEGTFVQEKPSIESIARYRSGGKTERDAWTALARGLDLRGRNFRYANFRDARLYKVDLRDAKMQGANLRGADLQGAKLKSAQMQVAIMNETKLQGADLQHVNLRGARLSGSHMQGVTLKNASMEGANLRGVQMQGADLERAQLQGASFRNASLQGANLLFANAQGADLRHTWMHGADTARADFTGADLRRAQIQGASFETVKLIGADLRGAEIWQTTPPNKPEQIQDTSLTFLFYTQLDPALPQPVLDSIEISDVRHKVAKALWPLLDKKRVDDWTDSKDHEFWKSLSESSKREPDTLAETLVRIACDDKTGGHVIRGISQRVFRFLDVEGTDYDKQVAEKIIDPKICPAAIHLSETRLNHLRKKVGAK